MKKFLYLASAATLALASCSDDLGIKAPGSDAAAGDVAITATYTIGGEDAETRTTLGAGYNYYWNLGDQIGVLGAVQALNVVNEPFVYNSVQSATSGSFSGKVNIEAGEGYVGYYPWTRTSGLQVNYTEKGELASFVLTNSYEQNFNTDAAKATWSDKRANGSFSDNAAPAVAYATANANGQLNYSFKPVAAYLVFPITAMEDLNITSVTLQVSDGDSGYQNLVQDCLITIPEGYEYTKYAWGSVSDGTVTAGGASSSVSAEEAQKIILYCSGQGVQVGPTNGPTNFWFVVPTGIKLADETVTLTVTTSDGNVYTLSRELEETWAGTESGATEQNTVTWLWQSTGHYFTINPGDYYYIETPAQFLEYAFVVSHGIGTTYNNYWKNLTNLSATDLPNMLYGLSDEKPYNGNLNEYVSANSGSTSGLGVRQGIISGTLDVSPAAVQEYLKANSLTNIVKQGQYYPLVYEAYAFNNEPLAPIGGGTGTFTLGGLDKDNIATLTGLVTNGSVFTSTQNNSTNIQYLTLKNCTASYPSLDSYRPFISQGQKATFTDLTVGAGCNVNGKTSAEDNVGLFNVIGNSYIYKIAVANQVFDIYAQQLNYSLTSVDFFNGYTFDFTAIEGAEPQNFVNIVNNPDDTAVTKALFVVKDRTMAGYLIQNGKVTKNGETFSVISMGADGKTPEWSYWTGGQLVSSTPTKGLNTAEYLYYKISNTASADLEFDMNINLDMMASFENTEGETETMYWYAIGNAGNPITVNTSETGNVIANVYMNGLKGSEQGSTTATPSTILAPLGYSSIVPELLNIINVEVSVPNTANNYVAAVSATAGGKSNVKVQNLKVTLQGNLSTSATAPTFVNNAIGGLYSLLDQNSLGNIGLECSYSNNYPLTGFNAGVVAGYLSMTLGQNVTVNVPYVGPGQEFGRVAASFSDNSSWLNIGYASKANTSSWKNWTITGSKDATLYVSINGADQVYGQATGNGNVYGNWQSTGNYVKPTVDPTGTYGSKTGW